MNTSSKILFILGVTLLVLSVSTSYYRYVVLHDYTIKAEMDCDPSEESCFVYICDSEYEECTGDPEEDTWYYKYLYRNAQNIPLCDPYNTDNCSAFTCDENEVGCYEEFCSKNLLEEGKVCSSPADFEVEDVSEEPEEPAESIEVETEEEIE